MSTEIGFGIVGAGMVARYHARAIAETPGARLAAICRADAARADEAAAELGVPCEASLVEEGIVTVFGARSARIQFPARFLLLAAMSPCEFVAFLPRLQGEGHLRVGGCGSAVRNEVNFDFSFADRDAAHNCLDDLPLGLEGKGLPLIVEALSFGEDLGA